uniref:Uncharacterized protein n=1 Tax=Monodelphis domestica TaxID=13616 RepID=A0A5F8GFY2_MONDO
MDPEENNLLDLPGYEGIEDEAFQPFPPPASPGRDNAGEEELTTATMRNQMGEMPIVTKKMVKRNLSKFDAEINRLKSSLTWRRD